jgi:exopolysaccharide production protein ExoQ
MHLPPVVALWLTLAFIFFVYRREARLKTNVSNALWIPLLWLLITCSRSFSQWLYLSRGIVIESPEDGSPIDAAVFLGLILSGYYILRKRGVSVSIFVRENRWLAAFFIFTLISIAWSDFPFIAGKRWIKILGHPIMVLIVLTDPDPVEAVKWLFKRIAYVLIPLSICFIKYFPQYGRGFDPWTGEAFYSGVATTKNELGCLCLILGIFFFWNTLQALRIKNRKTKRRELITNVGFLGLDWWLLSQASSATSLVMMVLGIIVIWVLGLPFVNKRYIGLYLITAILLFAALEPIFGIYATVVKGLGRNLTLTGRTDLWAIVLKLQDNPIFGMGFESFWLGKRLDVIWSQETFRPLQAHNGYIEVYLNLGLVGIGLLIGQFVGTFQKIKHELLRRFEFGRLRLAFLLAIILYNYTEAVFTGTSFVWTVFFLIAVDYPCSRRPGQSFMRKQPDRKRASTAAAAKQLGAMIMNKPNGSLTDHRRCSWVGNYRNRSLEDKLGGVL